MVGSQSATVRHFWRYCIAGGLAAVVHFAVLIGLVEGIGVVPVLASAVGFCLAVVFNYTLQFHWTFTADGPHAKKFFRFTLIAVFALVVNTGIFWLCNVAAALPYLVSQVVATGTVVMLNFHLNRHYVFSTDAASEKTGAEVRE